MRLKEDVSQGKNGREIVTVGYVGLPVVYPSHWVAEGVRHTEWVLEKQSVDLVKGEITYTWTAV